MQDAHVLFLVGSHRTRLLVTNQLQYARPADRILYMAEGRVVEAGTYDELMERGGGFAQLMQQTEVRASCIAAVAGPCFRPYFRARGPLEASAQSSWAPTFPGRCNMSAFAIGCQLVIRPLVSPPTTLSPLGSSAEPTATSLPACLPVCSTCCWAQHPVCVASRCLRRLQSSQPCSCCTSSGTRQAPPAHPLQPPATCP